MSARKTAGILGTLGALYLAQGLPYGFFVHALPTLLRERGHGLVLVGLSSLVALPWALKALLGPWVDASPRPLAAWIALCQVVGAAGLFTASLAADAGALSMLAALALATSAVSATQDVATDALAVDMLSPALRGPGNGVQVAAYRVGMILGGGALLIVADRVGFRIAGTLSAALLLASSLVLIACPWQRRVPPAHRPAFAFGKPPGGAVWIGLLLSLKAGEGLAVALLRPLLVDLGGGLEEVGMILGLGGSVAGFTGALVGGFLAGRLGHSRALRLGVGLQTLGLFALVAAPSLSMSSIAALVAAEALAGGTATAALFTGMMDKCRQGREATDYSLQASLVVAATGLAATVSGLLATALGYAPAFALGGALSAFAMWLAIRPEISSRPAAAGTHPGP
jgi:MFS transporter, PAT family, beta-lactamase induction signal transducer AmpG